MKAEVQVGIPTGTYTIGFNSSANGLLRFQDGITFSQTSFRTQFGTAVQDFSSTPEDAPNEFRFQDSGTFGPFLGVFEVTDPVDTVLEGLFHEKDTKGLDNVIDGLEVYVARGSHYSFNDKDFQLLQNGALGFELQPVAGTDIGFV